MNASEITSPIVYLSLLENVFNVGFQICTLRIIWTRQRQFLKIVNFASVSLQRKVPDNLNSRTSRLESSSFLNSFCTFSLIVSILRLQHPSPVAYPEVAKQVGTFQGLSNVWYYGLLKEAKYTFFMENYDCYINPTTSSCDSTLISTFSSTIDGVVAGVMFTSLLCRFIMGSFGNLLVLMYVLTLSTSVTRFITTLKSQYWQTDIGRHLDVIKMKIKTRMVQAHNSERETRCILEAYESLRKLAKLLNNAFGDALICFLGEGLFLYAMNLNFILVLEYRVVTRVYFYAVFVWSLLAAAGIPAQVSTDQD